MTRAVNTRSDLDRPHASWIHARFLDRLHRVECARSIECGAPAHARCQSSGFDRADVGVQWRARPISCESVLGMRLAALL